jgi:cytidylate kinase
VVVECVPENGRIKYLVEGEEPGNRIRTPEINAHASPVATVKAVRDQVTAILRSLVGFGDLVVEGRDITTAVFPDTPARFYLTASADVRALRRQKEEVEKGIAEQSAESVKASLLARDEIDSSRKHAPLRKADGVIEIDSSDMNLEQVVESVMCSLPDDWQR